MKGTVKDLRMAEELAAKGRFADALKVVDRMMGVTPGAAPADKVAAMRAAVLSKEPLVGEEEIVDRPDGQAEIKLNFGRAKLGGEWAGDLLLLRTRWLVAYMDAARSQEVIKIELAEMSMLIDLLQDPQVQQSLKPEDTASLLSLAADPFFIINDHDTVAMLLQSALFRAPASQVALNILRSLVGTLRGNLQKDNPQAIANREKYRASIAKLEPLLVLAETAAEVVGNGVPPDAETIKRLVAERLASRSAGAPPPAPPPPAAAPAASPPPPAEQPKKPGFFGRLFGKS
jgi:hypothetical protein